MWVQWSPARYDDFRPRVALASSVPTRDAMPASEPGHVDQGSRTASPTASVTRAPSCRTATRTWWTSSSRAPHAAFPRATSATRRRYRSPIGAGLRHDGCGIHGGEEVPGSLGAHQARAGDVGEEKMLFVARSAHAGSLPGSAVAVTEGARGQTPVDVGEAVLVGE